MSAIDRLYDINNPTIKKSINIDDTLYEKVIKLTRNRFCATVGEIVNVCIEDYVVKNNPTYYEKPKRETVTYRSIMIREKNLRDLQKMNKKTGITVTRLLNAAIKEFLESL
ncbi:MAG: hypothetical protein Q4G05_00115 [Clostridia bacterium]|nr:hypothetical protein [Clostridia bacterium]